MILQGNYIDNHNLPMTFRIEVPLTHMDLQSKFGWGDPLIKPRDSAEWISFERWLINNYLPNAKKITTCYGN